MESDALRLGELVCARVCHDLGGLAGTLAGALQLAQEDAAAGATVYWLEPEVAALFRAVRDGVG